MTNSQAPVQLQDCVVARLADLPFPDLPVGQFFHDPYAGELPASVRLASINEAVASLRFVVIMGPLASGKSAVFDLLKHLGAQVLDVESLISSDLHLSEAQCLFEMRLLNALASFDDSKVVLLKDMHFYSGPVLLPKALSAVFARPSEACMLSSPSHQRAPYWLSARPLSSSSMAQILESDPTISSHVRSELHALAQACDTTGFAKLYLESVADPAYRARAQSICKSVTDVSQVCVDLSTAAGINQAAIALHKSFS